MTTSNNQPVADNQTNATSEETKASSKEYNFAQLRKAREQAEYGLEQERQQRLKAEAELETLRKSRASIPEGEDDDFDDSEPYIDKKSLKKHLKRAKQENRQEIVQDVEQRVQKAVEEERKRNEELRMKFEYPDFNEILNEENAQKLMDKRPQLAQKILRIPDEQLRKELAYQAIKELNIHKKEEPKSNVQDQINKNQKPLYYTPSGMGAPGSNAVDFSEVGQKNAWENMKKLIKNRRS